MEEEILKIIRSNDIRINKTRKSAKEITSMVMEFIEWKDNSINVGRRVDLSDANKTYYVSPDFQDIFRLTLNELFEYWNNNIRKP